MRRRAANALAIAERGCWLLDMGLGHLALTRAGEAVHLALAVDGLRRAGGIEFLPHGLLARGTQDDLDEVHKIATRCGMRLHLTDYHLARARLDLREGRRDKARHHFEPAAQLVADTDYHRRDPEVAELRAVLAE